MKTRRAAFLVILGSLLSACSSSQSESGQAVPSDTPLTVHVVNNSNRSVDVSALFGTSPAQVIGTLSARGSGTFAFFWRGGDLRMIVDFTATRRSATSNALTDSGPGDVLELVIRSDGTSTLSRPR